MRATNKMLDSQEVMTTQKKINRPSDDPSGYGRVLTMRKLLSKTVQFERNIERIQSINALQDTSLMQVIDLLTRAKEIAVSQAGDATTNSTSREASAIELVNLRDQLLNNANTKGINGFLYSGYSTDVKPFDDVGVAVVPDAGNTGGALATAVVSNKIDIIDHDYQIVFSDPTTFDVIDVTTSATVLVNQSYVSGDDIDFFGITVVITDDTGTPLAGDQFDVTITPAGAYNGDSNVMRVEIESGSFIDVSIAGDGLFNGVGVINGIDIFDVFNTLIDNLREEDTAGIDASLDRFDQAMEQIEYFQSQIGARTNTLENSYSRLEELTINLTTLISNTEDVDITEAVSQLAQRETAYQAAMGAAMQMVSQSLFDFLR